MATICSVEGCKKSAHYKDSGKRGYCSAHYRRWKRHGDPLGTSFPFKRGDPCLVDGCEKPSRSKGYCAMHLRRLERHGGTGPGKFETGVKEPWLIDHAKYAQEACLRWPFRLEHTGYGSLLFRGASTTAHRAMCILAHGEPADQELEAAHSCNNRWCVNPKHLRWATAQENAQDRNEHGTMLIGERNPQHVLTEDQVREIRAYEGREILRRVAAIYGVSICTVHRIWQRKAWAWLE